MKRIILSALLILLLGGQLLMAKSDQEMNLHSLIRRDYTMRLTQEDQDLLRGDIMELQVFFTTKDGGEQCLKSGLFLRAGKELQRFESAKELIQSPQFLKALRRRFRLKKEVDALTLRTLLYSIDSELNGKIFHEKDGQWVFVCSKFFDDLRYYLVSTDRRGRIQSIKYEEREKAPSGAAIEATERKVYRSKGYTLSQEEKELIDSAMAKTYGPVEFTLKPFPIEGLGGELQLYDGEVGVRQNYGEGASGRSSSQFVLISDGKDFSVVNRPADLLDDPTFASALKSNFRIKDEHQALAFEQLLDELSPADSTEKHHYQQGEIWAFVRGKTFDDEEGVLVLTGQGGEIRHIERSGKIDKSSFYRMKTYDPGFKVHYGLKLEAPAEKELSLTGKDEVDVKVSFNADAANALDLYIATFFDGRIMGFDAGNVSSPYLSHLEGRYFDDGEHVVEYALLPSGEKDPSRAKASVRLKLRVSGSFPEAKRKLLDAFCRQLVGYVGTRDEKGFLALFASQEELKNLAMNIKEKCTEARKVADYIRGQSPEKRTSQRLAAFRGYLKEIPDEVLRKGKPSFKDCKDRRIVADYSGLHLIRIGIVLEVDEVLGLIQCNVVMSGGKIYLLEYEPSDMFMPKAMMGY